MPLRNILWEFPGGKRENGESLLETLQRELKEELDITVTSAHLFKTLEHCYDKEGYIVHLSFFHVTSYQGEPKALEGQKLAWLSPAEALKRAFLPADQPILTQLGALLLMQKKNDALI